MGVVNEKVINVCCTWRKETTDSEPFQGNFNAESDKFLLPIEKDYNLLTKFPFSFSWRVDIKYCLLCLLFFPGKTEET